MNLDFKVDVAVQSFKKPESLIYTLLSLKKVCGNLIDTIYINDDCSNDSTVEMYKNSEFLTMMSPIKIKVRVNEIPSGYTHTLMTKKAFSKKKIIKKIQLLLSILIKRCKFYKTDNDIRYQWAINETDKKYLFIIHDDILFKNNVLEIYLNAIQSKEMVAIVGDLGGSRRCPFGKCGENCSPKKIMEGYRPCPSWPITGKYDIFHSMLGRYKRNCRINEWCCLIDVNIARKLVLEEGTYFGNYEGGGDVACYWFERIIYLKYNFIDPLPTYEERKNYYIHWWQGHSGHSVWVDEDGNGKKLYESELIKRKLNDEFGLKL